MILQQEHSRADPEHWQSAFFQVGIEDGCKTSSSFYIVRHIAEGPGRLRAFPAEQDGPSLQSVERGGLSWAERQYHVASAGVILFPRGMRRRG